MGDKPPEQSYDGESIDRTNGEKGNCTHSIALLENRPSIDTHILTNKSSNISTETVDNLSNNIANKMVSDIGDNPIVENENLCLDMHVSNNGIDLSHPGDSEQFDIIKIRILYKKEKYDLSINNSSTIKDLKEEISKLTGLHTTLQKIMFKGLVKDAQTLKELGASDGSKFMVIGSTIDDILSIRPPDKTSLAKIENTNEINHDNILCKQRIHVKVLEKGKPDDAMIGIKNTKEPLPYEPLSGMLERGGGKLRLTFKLELDQLWIGTKDRTQKIPLNSIVAIVSEAIEGHEEYHIMGIQLGPTEASRYWIYWVPAQYIESIKKQFSDETFYLKYLRLTVIFMPDFTLHLLRLYFYIYSLKSLSNYPNPGLT